MHLNMMVCIPTFFLSLTHIHDFINLLFYQSILPVFNCFNLILQWEDPYIHIVQDQCESLMRKVYVLIKFIELAVIRNVIPSVEVDIGTRNQLSDWNIFIDIVARKKLLKLEREGDVSSTASKMVLHGVCQFYITADIKTKFPIVDEVLINVKFIDLVKRGSTHICNVHYFMEWYSTLPSPWYWLWWALWWICYVSASEWRWHPRGFVQMDVIWTFLN